MVESVWSIASTDPWLSKLIEVVDVPQDITALHMIRHRPLELGTAYIYGRDTGSVAE